jgi:hypothetical protein
MKMLNGGKKMITDNMSSNVHLGWRINAIMALVVLLTGLGLSGCYIPGIGGTADDPPSPTDPTGVANTIYGKFYVYQMADGKVKTLGDPDPNKDGPNGFDYFVGEVYYPANDGLGNSRKDYNIKHIGDGTYTSEYVPIYGNTVQEQTFFYKDISKDIRNASSYPEGLIVSGQLTLYYTNHWMFPISFGNKEGDCVLLNDNTQDAEETPNLGTSWVVNPYNYIRGRFHNAGGVPDIDYFRLDIPTDNMLVVIRIRHQAIAGQHQDIDGGFLSADFLHKGKLSLYDSSGNPLFYPNGQPVESRTAVDFWKWTDAELTYHFDLAGTYFIRVEDTLTTDCTTGDALPYSHYLLQIENPGAMTADNNVRKGEIQPARSGNPRLDGGRDFEPDDMSTKVEDLLPDCDGVPGSGDEGDWGIFEHCYGYTDWGSGDGAMQYQEVDDKENIDDGEYFIGQITNVGTTMRSEPTVIKNPAGNNLIMFINYGNRIYMLESLDGMDGKQWDTSNVVNNRPSIVPRMQRGNGDPTAPVVSSGPLGYCDTQPAPGDVYAFPELADAATAGGVTATATGGLINIPVAYPDQSAITFGDNHHIDSIALVDDLVGNTIYSGNDGIVNTLFPPKYEAYWRKPGMANNYAYFSFPVSAPDPSDRVNGPGNPPDPTIWSDLMAGFTNPLAGGTGGSNTSGYLLGDDEWNPAIFTGSTLSPPAYMQKQGCTFYNIGDNFDKCAYAVPSDENGNVPVAIDAGGDRELDTVEWVLNEDRGDDRLCEVGPGDSVAICPGPDGKFGWNDIYIPIEGDDELTIVFDPAHDLTAYTPNIVTPFWPLIQATYPGFLTVDRNEVGIGPGPDGILQTQIISGYTLLDIDNWTMYVGGDHYCQTLSGQTAICPGIEFTIDLYSGANSFRESNKLMSVWPMYMNNNARYNIDPGNQFVPGIGGWAYLANLLPPRVDHYGIADDNFCIVNGDVGICSGVNEYFQSYPLFTKINVAHSDDLFDLYDNVSNLLDLPCYQMVSEQVQNHQSEEMETRYILYKYVGVLQDDEIRRDPVTNRIIVNTGQNGINQSCMAPGDIQRIPYHQGYPDMPIITPGTDGIMQTYPMRDREIWWTANVKKIVTGPDGVNNSFAIGDDRLELYFGLGKPDMPCVLAGPDGIADTTAQSWINDNTLPVNANDTQLYEPGEITGFDSFHVWGADALAYNGIIYLYYSALGWDVMPEQFRGGAGALAGKGECERAGLDREWGSDRRDYDFSNGTEKLHEFDRILSEPNFRQILDNGQGVFLAPRIGSAVSSVTRLRIDPSDWNLQNKPALDIGQQCAGDISFPIDLPLDLPGLIPDVNYNGAFSPDSAITIADDGESPLWLLFYTGLSSGAERNNVVDNSYQIGLARSLDGRNFEVVRDIDPLISTSSFDLTAIIGSSTDYGWATIVPAGEDEYGEPMFGMFFNQFETDIGNLSTPYDLRYFDLRTKDHIGYALRKGKIQLSGCSISGQDSASKTASQSQRSKSQLLLLLAPLALVAAARLFRKEEE